MDVIEKFGNRVSSQALKDPEKARRLLLAGYRLQEKKLQFLPDRELPSSGQYVARVVMKNIIQSLSEPENAAMVSIFVPGELVMAAGLTPYSVEGPVLWRERSVSRRFFGKRRKKDFRRRCVRTTGCFWGRR